VLVVVGLSEVLGVGVNIGFVVVFHGRMVVLVSMNDGVMTVRHGFPGT
jgi:hypothetical protein